MSLFERPPIHFDLPEADISYYPDFLPRDQADACFEKLRTEIPWRQDDITLFGKTHPQPRLTALFGNEGKPYSYSGIVMQPLHWTPLLVYLKEAVESVCGESFTTVLLNLYRDGRDSNGWHADDEKELGRNPAIASLSLGAARYFHLRHNLGKAENLKLFLEHGSLLVMKGATQHAWKHQVPKTARPVGERINLTFRSIR